jgi:hypothetical protein
VTGELIISRQFEKIEEVKVIYRERFCNPSDRLARTIMMSAIYSVNNVNTFLSVMYDELADEDLK